MPKGIIDGEYDYKSPEKPDRKNPVYIITPKTDPDRVRGEVANDVGVLLLGNELDTISIFLGKSFKNDEKSPQLFARTDGSPLWVFNGSTYDEKMFHVGAVGGKYNIYTQTMLFDHLHDGRVVKAATEIKLLRAKNGIGMKFDWSSGANGNILVVQRSDLCELEGEEYEALRNAKTPDPFFANRGKNQRDRLKAGQKMMAYTNAKYDKIANDVTKNLNSEKYLIK